MGDEVGPVSSAELKKLAAANVIDRDTVVRPANGTTRSPAYRLKGLFPADNIATEPVVPPVPMASTVQPTRPLATSKTSRGKLDPLTLTLAGGLCFFALTTVVLLFLLISDPSDTKPLAATNQSQPKSPFPQPTAADHVNKEMEDRTRQPKSPSPQPTVAATPLPQSKVEDSKEPALEIVAEASPVTSPDVFITEIAKRLGVEAMFVEEIGDITLLVGVEQLRAYVPKNYNYPVTTGTDIGFDIRFLTADKSVQKPSAGFIPINGKPEHVKMSSSDPSLIQVFDDGSAGVRGAGNAVVSVECAGTRISIPIQVVATPFSVGYGESDPKQIIATLGIPQRKQSHVVRWPQSEIIDQMYYGPDAGSQEVGEHWEYDKLPGLAIRVIGSFVKDIGMRDRPPSFTPKIIRP